MDESLKKRCNCCAVEKPIESFHKHKKGFNGRYGICRQCEADKRQTPEAIKRRIDRYEEANRKRSKEYLLANGMDDVYEKKKEYQSLYYKDYMPKYRERKKNEYYLSIQKRLELCEHLYKMDCLRIRKSMRIISLIVQDLNETKSSLHSSLKAIRKKHHLSSPTKSQIKYYSDPSHRDKIAIRTKHHYTNITDSYVMTLFKKVFGHEGRVILKEDEAFVMLYRKQLELKRAIK